MMGDRQNFFEVNVQVSGEKADQQLLPGGPGDHLEKQVEPGEMGSLDPQDEEDPEHLVRVLLAEYVYQGEREALIEKYVTAVIDYELADLISPRSSAHRGR